MSKFRAFITVVLTFALVLTSGSAMAVTAITTDWAVSYSPGGSSTYVRLYSSATDGNGNVYAGGMLQAAGMGVPGWTTIGGTQYNSAGAEDMLLVKYDSTGALVWVKQFGTAATEEIQKVLVAPNGNILITGRFCGNLTIAPLSTITTSGFCDGYLAALDGNGDGLWVQQFGSPGMPNNSYGLATDAGNNIYVNAYLGDAAGYSTTSVPGITISITPSNNLNGSTVIKFNSAGTAQWAKVLPNRLSIAAKAIAVRGTRILVGGNFTAAATVDSLGTFTPNGADGWLGTFDTTGSAFDFIKVIGGASTQNVQSVAFTADGSIVGMSEIQGTAVLNSQNYVSAGGWDTLIYKLAGPSGTTDWATRVGGTGSTDTLGAILVDANDRVIASGLLTGTQMLGSTNFTAASSAGDGVVVVMSAAGNIEYSKQFSTGASGTLYTAYTPSLVGDKLSLVGILTGGNANLGDGVNVTWGGSGSYSAAVLARLSIPAAASSSSSSSVQQIVANPDLLQIDKISNRVFAENAENTSTLSGKNLDLVSKITVGGIAVKITSKSYGQLTFDLPNLIAGKYEMVTVSSSTLHKFASAFTAQKTKTAVLVANTARNKVTLADLESQFSEVSEVRCTLRVNTTLVTQALKTQLIKASQFCALSDRSFKMQVSKVKGATSAISISYTGN